MSELASYFRQNCSPYKVEEETKIEKLVPLKSRHSSAWVILDNSPDDRGMFRSRSQDITWAVEVDPMRPVQLVQATPPVHSDRTVDPILVLSGK